MKRHADIRTLALAAITVISALGCDPQSDPTLARQCTFNGDCNSPLVCAGGFCRAQCMTDRDCPVPSRCRTSDLPDKNVCLPPSAPALCIHDLDCPQPRGVCDRGLCFASCDLDSQCAPIVGIDGEAFVCLHPESHCLRPISTAQELADASFPVLPDGAGGDGHGGDGALDGSTDGADIVHTVDAADVLDAGDAGDGALVDAPFDTRCSMCVGSDACVDLANDPANCGSCGFRCTPTDGGVAACVGGHCIPTCAPGFIQCGMQCVDPLTTRDNCGACGTLCAVQCIAGVCLAPNAILSSHTQSLGTATMVVRLDDGSARAWGGAWTTTPPFPIPMSAVALPVALPGLTAADDLAVGGSQLCVRSASMATLRCAGQNMSGSLGIGNSTPTGMLTDVTLSGVLGVAAGETHSCAWRNESRPNAHDQVVCWGSNAYGELGDGGTGSRMAPVPTLHAGVLQDALQVVVGSQHTCALLADHSVQCWGLNNSGQLGTGDAAPRLLPAAVQWTVGGNIAGATRLAAADSDTCAIVGDAATGGGTVWCWGVNSGGECGGGTSTIVNTATRVGTLTGATRIAISGDHGCAVLADHALWCWGRNVGGELGDGTTIPSSGALPIRVRGVAGVGSFAADDVAVTLYATCALATQPDRNVYCWGASSDAILGYNGATSTPTPGEPVMF